MSEPGPTRSLVVWLSGNSGAGKTFTGDALAHLAGFAHIDGDELMWSQEPTEKALWGGLVAAFWHWFEGRPAPAELWQPLYALQCARVRAALAAGHPRVVVSLTVYHRETRDFLRRELPEHVYVLLRCGREELVQRARTRFAPPPAIAPAQPCPPSRPHRTHARGPARPSKSTCTALYQ
jgi:adenylate kinase family enzyme